MSIEHMLAFVLFATVAAITPGPSNMLLTATGAAVGMVRGLPSVCGVAIGMGILMFLVTLGLGSLVLENAAVIQALKWCGSAFLLWLSWKIATAERNEATAPNRGVGFWQAAAFQWVNPKSWLVCASAAGTYLDARAGSAVAQSLSLGLLFIVAALPSCFIWLAFGASVQRLIRTQRASRVFNVAMGILLAGSVLLIFL
jgi:threonine/homoserine/homoserine lactone efflux protein